MPAQDPQAQQGPAFPTTDPQGMAGVLMQMLGVAEQGDQQQLAAMQQQALPGALQLIMQMLSQATAPPQEGMAEGSPVSAVGAPADQGQGYQ